MSAAAKSTSSSKPSDRTSRAPAAPEPWPALGTTEAKPESTPSKTERRRDKVGDGRKQRGREGIKMVKQMRLKKKGHTRGSGK